MVYLNKTNTKGVRKGLKPCKPTQQPGHKNKDRLSMPKAKKKKKMYKIQNKSWVVTKKMYKIQLKVE